MDNNTISNNDMSSGKVAYICDGLMPECSGKVGCFKYPGAAFDPSMTCFHTLDPEHAKNGPCEDPEAECPERFKKVQDEIDIEWFEESERTVWYGGDV